MRIREAFRYFRPLCLRASPTPSGTVFCACNQPDGPYRRGFLRKVKRTARAVRLMSSLLRRVPAALVLPKQAPDGASLRLGCSYLMATACAADTDKEHHQGSDHQQSAGEHECLKISAEADPQYATQIGRSGAADLMY